MIFDMFRRQPSRKKEASSVDDQAVILEINLEGVDDFGTKADRESVFALEDEITTALPSRSEVDGHEFGEGTATIYIYGESADLIIAKISKILKKSSFNRIDVTLRYGRAEDPKAKEKSFSL